ncbi:MAG: phosphoglycerate dehydrogenase [Jatrophihabitans sp.]|nr:MAG: phosphoglycerate dehydrogenase [Jatrophihabitans sp.]
MTITVCVPDERFAAALEGLAVRVVTSLDPPADTEFLVPIYMAGPVPAATLAALPRLKVVQLLSAGYESWRSVLPAGVTLCNARGVHGASTAELAVGGLIAVLRDLPRFAEQQRTATWERHRGDTLDGASVLVLGAGDIGARVAGAVSALGADVTMVGRTARDGIRTLADVGALLPYQQAVVVALPLTPATAHLLDAQFLAALPDGAVVVNVARGAIVDTGALLAELRRGRLRAFLDVTDPEPLPAGHPLWHAPNLLLTPHVGGGTTGWERRARSLVRAQVGRYLAGEPLVNEV